MNGESSGAGFNWRLLWLPVLAAVGGSLGTTFVTGPVQRAEITSRVLVTAARLEGRMTLFEQLQREVRTEQREQNDRIEALAVRLSIMEQRARVRWSGPEPWPGSAPRNDPDPYSP